ncbi:MULTISPECIES: hydroxymethylbilane synthase [Microbacterium]|uniref:hydroxymethylbilane synthase n=1 Tax=Microbacterium TaxID=33882 RepID=UPI00217DE188|nr:MULTISPECIES: hydroxymethylbilane synthase [Microbacterium]UWF77379.1 hydroxymethylbilane synthase [Microbacterium neungamense]WCM55541.1 hydroxymethylbilane synthase [Microbacterium sp. EF45047]
MSAPIRLGTRRSALAQAQSGQVAAALEKAAGRPVELVPITSEGDTNRASLSEIGGRGVFATRLREALLAGDCDILVHSLKDLPTAVPEGLVIAATPPREDARDVVITRGGTPLHELRSGSTVGTGAPRRIAQVRRRAPHAQPVDIRGNVDSRLERVASGELDAVILAAAGLSRLGAELKLHREDLGLAEWPTAPGQGALAVETTADAPAELRQALARLDDEDTRIAVTVERAILAGLESGCQAPMAAHAAVTGDTIRIRTVVYEPGGARRIGLDVTERLNRGYIRRNGSGNGADAADDADPMRAIRDIGMSVAHRLLEQGAADLLPRE